MCVCVCETDRCIATSSAVGAQSDSLTVPTVYVGESDRHTFITCVYTCVMPMWCCLNVPNCFSMFLFCFRCQSLMGDVVE